MDNKDIAKQLDNLLFHPKPKPFLHSLNFFQVIKEVNSIKTEQKTIQSTLKKLQDLFINKAFNEILRFNQYIKDQDNLTLEDLSTWINNLTFLMRFFQVFGTSITDTVLKDIIDGIIKLNQDIDPLIATSLIKQINTSLDRPHQITTLFFLPLQNLRKFIQEKHKNTIIQHYRYRSDFIVKNFFFNGKNILDALKELETNTEKKIREISQDQLLQLKKNKRN